MSWQPRRLDELPPLSARNTDAQVEECFSLSAWPFYLSYIDDDGEEFSVRTEDDLTEAIAYFVSGDDDHSSLYSRSQGISIAPSKITLRLDVVVEYDGPSLSDTSSIASYPTSGSSFMSKRSGSERSGLSSGSRLSDPYSDRHGDRFSGYSGSAFSRDGQPTPRLSEYSAAPPGYAVGSRRSSATSATHRRPSAGQLSERFSSVQLDDRSSVSTPNFTQSELGSRWLREQSQIASRMPRLRMRTRAYESDEGSDEEIGDISLVRDARGREYCRA